MKVTASKYPFPTVCANQQSTDWFLAISRTLKWNERERQKSFVVVEEDAAPPVSRTKRRSVDTTTVVTAVANPPGEDDEDEYSEEEEQFDIADSAPEVDVSSACPRTTEVEDIAGIEKWKLGISNPKRSPSRSRSPARTSSSFSPPPSGVVSPNRYTTKPPHPSLVASRHVGFNDLSSSSSSSSDSLVTDATHEATMVEMPPPYHESRIPKDRDFGHIKTPTATHHGHRPSEPRVFAVLGQDESDSATSDAEC